MRVDARIWKNNQKENKKVFLHYKRQLKNNDEWPNIVIDNLHCISIDRKRTKSSYQIFPSFDLLRNLYLQNRKKKVYIMIDCNPIFVQQFCCCPEKKQNVTRIKFAEILKNASEIAKLFEHTHIKPSNIHNWLKI